MAKNKKFDRQTLMEQKREMDRKFAKIAICCPHTKKNGQKNNLVQISGKKELWQCRECETVFSLNVFSEDEIIKATDMLRSAMNQVKFLSTDPEGDDEKLVEKIGELEYNLREFPKIYLDTVSNRGKNKKKKNKQKRTIGSYGSGPVYFNRH